MFWGSINLFAFTQTQETSKYNIESNFEESKELHIGSPRRPENIDAGMYCFTCQLVIDMAVQSLGNYKDVDDIKKVIAPSNLCNPAKYFDHSIDVSEL